MFDTRSLTEDKIENAKNYPTIFITPGSNRWDPYDESYKLNKDSYLDNRGDMILTITATQNTIVVDADLSEVVADYVWNKKGEISSIDSILNTSIVEYQGNDARTEL